MTDVIADKNTLFSLPLELRTWADSQANFIQKIEDGLGNFTRMSESDLWELIAGSYSDEWREARKTVQAASQLLQERTDPDNRPLGAIGAALDGGELDDIKDMHNWALSQFTLHNENLRSEQRLQQMLKTLVQNQRTINSALASSQTAAGITARFNVSVSDRQLAAPAAKSADAKAALSSLRRDFEKNRSMTRKPAFNGSFKDIINMAMKKYIQACEQPETPKAAVTTAQKRKLHSMEPAK